MKKEIIFMFCLFIGVTTVCKASNQITYKCYESDGSYKCEKIKNDVIVPQNTTYIQCVNDICKEIESVEINKEQKNFTHKLKELPLLHKIVFWLAIVWSISILGYAMVH